MGDEGLAPIVDHATCQEAAKLLGMADIDVSMVAALGRSIGCGIEQGPNMQHICAVGEFGCQCVRQCANGGVLDVDSCTCKCPGDHRHGWTGPDCREEYGSCQAGDGSTNKV